MSYTEMPATVDADVLRQNTESQIRELKQQLEHKYSDKLKWVQLGNKFFEEKFIKQ